MRIAAELHAEGLIREPPTRPIIHFPWAAMDIDRVVAGSRRRGSAGRRLLRRQP